MMKRKNRNQRRVNAKQAATVRHYEQLLVVAAVVLITVAIGIVLVVTKALVSTANVEPEKGVATAPLSIVNDTTASGGSAVKFGTSSPSGQPMPAGDLTLNGHTWHQVIAEEFTKSATLGSWGSACANNVVYTGATGVQWYSYPQCYKDTYQKRYYRPDQVLSVHNGVLDFWLHTVDGHPAGANPSPAFSNGSQYQTYGVYSARLKLSTSNLGEYYQAWLLWPENDSDYQCAESDFPEAPMGVSSVGMYAHYCAATGNTQYGATKSLDRTQWHTYTQLWAPGVRVYYIDGVEIGRTTTNVWTNPQRWQLQTETNTTCDQVTPITCSNDGHLLVDWATVYSY